MKLPKLLDRIWNGKLPEPTTQERLDTHANRLADKLGEVPEDENQWAIRQLLLKEIAETEDTVAKVNEAHKAPARRKHWWNNVSPDTWAKCGLYTALTVGLTYIGYNADKDGSIIPKWAKENIGEKIFKL